MENVNMTNEDIMENDSISLGCITVIVSNPVDFNIDLVEKNNANAVNVAKNESSDQMKMNEIVSDTSFDNHKLVNDRPEQKIYAKATSKKKQKHTKHNDSNGEYFFSMIRIYLSE